MILSWSKRKVNQAAKVVEAKWKWKKGEREAQIETTKLAMKKV